MPRIVNSADIVAWNTDKHYLTDLAAAGVPVVPKNWIEPGQALDLPAMGVHVLKPAVGAGSVDAALFDMTATHEAELALAHADRLVRMRQTVMVQPYLEQIEEQGEAALIFFGGEFSHAVTKGAMLADQRELVSDLYKAEVITPRSASAAELDIARTALAAAPGGTARLLYARVDLVPGPDGAPLLIELELTEPSLFMGTAPGSAERLARQLVDHVSNPGSAGKR